MPLSEITWFMIDDFVLVNLGKKELDKVQDNTKVMMRLVKEIWNRNDQFFNAANNAIEVVDLYAIERKMMSDGIENWGRVAALFAACAKKLQTSEKNESEVREYLLKMMYSKKQDWDAFMLKFGKKEKKSVRDILMKYIGLMV